MMHGGRTGKYLAMRSRDGVSTWLGPFACLPRDKEEIADELYRRHAEDVIKVVAWEDTTAEQRRSAVVSSAEDFINDNEMG